jgi:hypothetical protein
MVVVFEVAAPIFVTESADETPRDDLRDQTPREVLLAQHDFIGWDMQDRSERWSQIGEPAPCLDPKSHAYRFAGFGTHELVTYYTNWCGT